MLSCIVVFLAGLGYQASQEWQRNAVRAAERRADELAALVIAALTKDMQGAQQALQPLEQDDLLLHPPYDIANTISQVFSRFPYPESFFVWKAAGAEQPATALFNRTDRLPPWSSAHTPSEGYPVTIVSGSEVADRLASLARKTVEPRSRFAFYHMTIGEVPYQVVARKYYGAASDKEAVAIVGFTVNLDWARRFYFPELISQVEHISGRKEASVISWAILDETGKIVIDNRAKADGPVRERRFPLAFFNSAAVAQGKLSSLPLRQWAVRINSTGDSFLGSANSSARNTKTLILFATVISIAGIFLSMYLWHSYLRLESMKTEFVARVSHELKTPLASISLVGDTLSQGRYTSGNSVKEYGAVLSRETKRLAKLVEDLLTFSRVADFQVTYSMADANIEEVVSEALERLRPQLTEKQFDVRLEGPDRESRVRCDRAAIIQVFENVIENAIRYSGEIRVIHIEVRGDAREIRISFRDGGKGIAPEDIPYVFSRFYRGKNASSLSGSGLGLSIAQKIIKDHGGRISVDSTPGKGTTVSIVLPANR